MKSNDWIKDGDIAYHSRTARHYDDFFLKEFSLFYKYSIRPFFDRLAASGKKRKALDLGCGTGFLALAMAKQGFCVTAVDHSPQMIEFAKNKAKAAGLSSLISFEEGSAENLSFKDGQFDCVTCAGLLHHMEKMSPVIEEMIRILKNGGLFYILEPCADQTILSKGIINTISFLRSKARTTKRKNMIKRHIKRRGYDDSARAPGEKPVNPHCLLGLLEGKNIVYQVEFLTYIPYIRKFLPDNLRMLITRVISFPWRKRKGNMIIIIGQKRY